MLVVDDEMVVREALRELLLHLGYEPLPAATGAAACELLRRDPQAVAAVLLDVVMPDMDGAEVLSALRDIAPAVPVLVMSGCSPEDPRVSLACRAANAFLPKPFALRELADALAAIIRH